MRFFPILILLLLVGCAAYPDLPPAPVASAASQGDWPELLPDEALPGFPFIAR